MTSNESLTRVRAEFEGAVKSEESIEDTLRSGLNLESSSDLTYLGYVIQEALRLNPVAPTSSPVHFEKDTNLGKLTVKAYDMILINFIGLHVNGSQW
mmetsp:Transcript_35435/g.43314  ORF Transcript_35435/g.43314 Transcript_35435/m.43314 type:complete len:97 (-) Transcript_35435:5-295(-)